MINSVSVSNNGAVSPATDPTAIVLPTSISLASSPNPSTASQPVTLTATLAGGGAGRVDFSDGGVLLGSAVLSGNQASMVTRALASGIRQLSATYAGDATHADSFSAPISQTVNALSTNGFAGAVIYPTGTNPWGVAAADLNLDGKLDLVVSNMGAGTVSVLLGNGDGTYQPKVDYRVTSGPASVVIADFNNDGKPDIAVANSTGATVSVLLGNGNGTFQAAVDSAAGTNPVSIAAADFNGDGYADLVVANQPNNGAVVLLGNGDGTFSPRVFFTRAAFIGPPSPTSTAMENPILPSPIPSIPSSSESAMETSNRRHT